MTIASEFVMTTSASYVESSAGVHRRYRRFVRMPAEWGGRV